MRLLLLVIVATLAAPAHAQEVRTYSTAGDFDGDGKRDVATYVVEPGKRTRLSARLSSQPAEVVIEETNGRYYGDYLKTVPAGTYTPSRACEDQPKPVVVKHDAISIGLSEAVAGHNPMDRGQVRRGLPA